MVKYICNICNKEFSKKSNFLYHTQIKKKPCKNKIINNTQITPINTQITPNNIIIFKKEKQNNIDNNIIMKRNCCNYCGIIFSRKDALTRHLKNICKIKKIEEEKKNEIFNKLLEKEEENDILQKENKILKRQIKKCDIKINTNIIQNIIIPPNRLVEFGKEDFTKIDNNNFFKTMNPINITGGRIFIEILKMIHFNEKLPEYQNIYITDKNREHYMIYNGKNWELNKNYSDEIIKQIDEILNIKLEEIDEENNINKYNKHVIEKIIKYKNLYFEDETNQERKEDFMKLVDERIKNYLYNNKHIPINNYTKLTNNLLINDKLL